MIRIASPLQLFTAFCLVTLTACSTTTESRLIGDPQAPYPLKTQPKVGDIVHLPTGTITTEAQMLGISGDARIVYVGETHDNPASHHLELQLLKGLSSLHPGQQALGMEMFTRSQQPLLDRWVAGDLDEKKFLKESKWYDSWSMDFAYYRELLLYARDHHIPLIALNAEKSLVASLRGKTLDQLSPEDRAQLPEMDLTDPYQRGMAEGIFGGHSHGAMHMEGFILTQTLWDETMAESITRYLSSPAGKDKHLLVIAGGNHVSYGFGIPRRAFRRLPVSYVTIGGHELNTADKKDRMMDVTIPDFPMVPYDFLAYITYDELPKTGVKLGVMMEPTPTGHGLLVKNVLPDSNAERAGVKTGDLLLSLDGTALAETFDLIYAVNQKHPGDHGMLEIERQGGTLKLEVTFAAPDSKGPHGKQ